MTFLVSVSVLVSRSVPILEDIVYINAFDPKDLNSPKEEMDPVGQKEHDDAKWAPSATKDLNSLKEESGPVGQKENTDAQRAPSATKDLNSLKKKVGPVGQNKNNNVESSDAKGVPSAQSSPQGNNDAESKEPKADDENALKETGPLQNERIWPRAFKAYLAARESGDDQEIAQKELEARTACAEFVKTQFAEYPPHNLKLFSQARNLRSLIESEPQPTVFFGPFLRFVEKYCTWLQLSGQPGYEELLAHVKQLHRDAEVKEAMRIAVNLIVHLEDASKSAVEITFEMATWKAASEKWHGQTWPVSKTLEELSNAYELWDGMYPPAEFSPFPQMENCDSGLVEAKAQISKFERTEWPNKNPNLQASYFVSAPKDGCPSLFFKKDLIAAHNRMLAVQTAWKEHSPIGKIFASVPLPGSPGHSVILMEKLDTFQYGDHDSIIEKWLIALRKIHSVRIKNFRVVHGDIKPDNMMLKDDEPRFIDFSPPIMKTPCFSGNYCSFTNPAKADLVALGRALVEAKYRKKIEDLNEGLIQRLITTRSLKELTYTIASNHVKTPLPSLFDKLVWNEQHVDSNTPTRGMQQINNEAMSGQFGKWTEALLANPKLVRSPETPQLIWYFSLQSRHLLIEKVDAFMTTQRKNATGPCGEDAERSYSSLSSDCKKLIKKEEQPGAQLAFPSMVEMLAQLKTEVSDPPPKLFEMATGSFWPEYQRMEIPAAQI